jgi:hypothetical protein
MIKKLKCLTINKCSLQRAFKTPILCYISKVYTRFVIIVKVSPSAKLVSERYLKQIDAIIKMIANELKSHKFYHDDERVPFIRFAQTHPGRLCVPCIKDTYQTLSIPNDNN